MMQGHWLTMLLGSMMTMTVLCSGFTPDRSVSTWNMASPLETEPKITVDHASSVKTEVTGTDKGLQISDTKASTKTAEQTVPVNVTHEKKFGFILESFDNDPRFPETKDANVAKQSNVAIETVNSVPRNVLMIVVETSQDEKDFWKRFKAVHSFPVEGTLHSCDIVEGEHARSSLEDPLISGNRVKKCDCEHNLRVKIATLMYTAREVAGMTTGTLSNANFTIPSIFEFEESIGLPREFYEIDENNMKPEVHKLKSGIRSDWGIIDFGKPISRVSSSSMAMENLREDADTAWSRVFSSLSKMKLLLLQSLMESLGRNAASSEESVPPPLKSHFRLNLASLLEETKSPENEKGFALVASISASELNSAFDLLRRESIQDTLLVVIGACPHDAKPVPFFAQGPSAKLVREASTVWDVPNVIKNIITNGCEHATCRDRHVLPAPLKIIPHNMAVLRRTFRNSDEKMDSGKKSETPVIKDEVKRVAELNAKVETPKDENKNTSAKAKKNSANSTVAEKFITFFGTLMSMIFAIALTS